MPEITDPRLLQQLEGAPATGPRPITLGAPDPMRPLDAQLKQGQIAAQGRDAQKAPFDAQKAAADAARATAEAKIAQMQVDQGVTSGRMTAEVRQKALAQWQSAKQLDQTIAGLEARYNEGPGATKGLASIKDFFPSVANQRFDTAANASRGIVRNALGLTGGEANTAAEAQMNLGAFIPQSGSFDATIEDTLSRLKQLRDSARQQAIATLGGEPDANGNVHPVAGKPAGPDWSWAGSPTGTGLSGPAAPQGSTTKQQEIPAAMQADFEQYIARNGRGNINPEDYARFRTEQNRRYGFGTSPDDIGTYRAEAEKLNAPGPVNLRIPGVEVPMSGVDQFRNNAVNNPAGGAAAGYLDMAGFGIPSALAGDKMGALSDAQTLPFALGQIGGAITGTKMLGEIGRNTIGRVAPSTLGGGARRMFGRGLATDAAFGGIYSGTTEGDPLSGALAGTIGSAAGQTIGKGVAKGLTGGGSTAASYLRSRGIPLTVGQAVDDSGFIGRSMKGIEDRLSGLPVIGDLVNARRLEGLKAFNEQALGDVAGNQVTQTGPEAVNQLRPAVSGMFDRATAGVNVPVGPQLASDITSAKTLGSTLPPDLAERFSLAMRNRIDPVIDGGQMTGEQFQQMQRALKGYRAESPKAGFEQDYRDNLSMVTNALDANMRAQGGGAVIDGLNGANEAYRRLKVVEDAVTRARNGSRSGEVGIFTPSQLNDASVANARKFGGTQATTNRPFHELADAGQRVLPSSVPDSGTAGRLATLALPGLLGGGGYGLDKAGLTDDGATTGLALGGLLTAGGTKPVQSALVKAILDRPDLVRRLGAKIGKRQGMFGSAAVPLFIEQAAP